MKPDEPEIEESPLSGIVSRDGISVHVQIYRIADSGDGWSLEVVDREGSSTVWEDLFATDKDAYAEFVETLEREGIASFTEKPPTKLN